jgi:hypothetical protein
MDTKDWTNEDWTQATIYGTCEFCGAPRTTRIDTWQEDGPDGPVTVRHMAMVCSRCGRHAT